jgi:hypothetical protein
MTNRVVALRHEQFDADMPLALKNLRHPPMYVLIVVTLMLVFPIASIAIETVLSPSSRIRGVEGGQVLD